MQRDKTSAPLYRLGEYVQKTRKLRIVFMLNAFTIPFEFWYEA